MVERVTRRGLIFLLSLFVIFSLFLVATVLPFFAYVFFGAFAAFLVWPAYRWLAPRIGRYVAAWGLVASVYAIIFVPLGLILFFLVRDLRRAAEHFLAEDVALAEILREFLAELFPPVVAEQAGLWLAGALETLLVRVASGIAASSLQVLLGIFIFGFVLFYSLLNGRQVVDFLRELIPLRDFRTDGLFQQIRRALNAVFYGVIFVALIQATAGGIVWWIAGLPNPFFFGAVMFVLSIMPFAGPSFVLIPAGLLRIYQGEIGWGIFLILSGMIFVGSIDNFLRPIMVSRFGHINPAMVVVGLAGGIVAFGVVGIAIGPLIFAVWVGIARELHYEIGQWKLTAFTPLTPAEEERERREHEQRLQEVGALPTPPVTPLTSGEAPLVEAERAEGKGETTPEEDGTRRDDKTP